MSGSRSPPVAGRIVLLAWSEVTGQQVKRSAAGAEGPVVDHLSATAVRHHLDVVGGALLSAVPAHLLGSVFSDSLEVYDAGWTAALPEQFRQRRGYDLLPVLHLLEVDAPGAEQVREDYGLTLSELVEEGFVGTCRAWAEEHGVRFRLQGYGQPPITLGAQRGAHLIEGEGAGWTALTQSRWASSAAHLDRREVVSSEVWTWVHSPSFRAAPLDLLGEAHEHLLLGITHFVGHGWPYTAPDAPGLGWTFYAAGALDDRNAWWPAMPELTAHLTRLCAALRLGAPGAEVALYLPYADVRAARSRVRPVGRLRAHIGEQRPPRSAARLRPRPARRRRPRRARPAAYPVVAAAREPAAGGDEALAGPGARRGRQRARRGLPAYPAGQQLSCPRRTATTRACATTRPSRWSATGRQRRGAEEGADGEGADGGRRREEPARGRAARRHTPPLLLSGDGGGWARCTAGSPTPTCTCSPTRGRGGARSR